MLDSIGDFPARWNTNAAGEIVTIAGKPGRWLKLTKGGVPPRPVVSVPSEPIISMSFAVRFEFPRFRNGKVVYDLNGLTRTDWDKLPKNYLQTGDPRWDGIMSQRRTAPIPPRGAR